jgi:hypothetical protein
MVFIWYFADTIDRNKAKALALVSEEKYSRPIVPANKNTILLPPTNTSC